jgi:hypothetical protein
MLKPCPGALVPSFDTEFGLWTNFREACMLPACTDLGNLRIYAGEETLLIYRMTLLIYRMTMQVNRVTLLMTRMTSIMYRIYRMTLLAETGEEELTQTENRMRAYANPDKLFNYFASYQLVSKAGQSNKHSENKNNVNNNVLTMVAFSYVAHNNSASPCCWH